MTKVLVTGASGFVGRRLCEMLLSAGFEVIAAVRAPEKLTAFSSEVQMIQMPDLGSSDQASSQRWKSILSGINTVVHLAARVHVMKDHSENPLEEFRRFNVSGTERLALIAAQTGVKKFVYISSIKAMGENTDLPFEESMAPHPEDAYGISKWEAEQKLQNVAHQTGMQLVVLRPPLIYGPGVKANFQNLMGAIHRGMPLPLGCIRNQRSLVFLDNFCDAIRASIQAPSAPVRTYLVSDGRSLSTPELIRELAIAMGKKPRLIPVPEMLLRVVGWLSGKTAAIHRLTGSLVLDTRKIHKELDWTPPFTPSQGLKLTAEWYLKQRM